MSIQCLTILSTSIFELLSAISTLCFLFFQRYEFFNQLRTSVSVIPNAAKHYVVLNLQKRSYLKILYICIYK